MKQEYKALWPSSFAMAVECFFSVSLQSSSFFRFVILLASLSLIAVIIIIIISFSSSSFRCLPLIPNTDYNPKPNPSPPIYSFVESLDKFLASRAEATDRTDSVASGEDLDNSIWSREMERLQGSSSSDLWPGISSVIRVYVYEMPPRFSYNLLSLFRNTYQGTANLTSNGSPVHRLIEQHSIDYWLWADLIAPESQRMLTRGGGFLLYSIFHNHQLLPVGETTMQDTLQGVRVVPRKL